MRREAAQNEIKAADLDPCVLCWKAQPTIEALQCSSINSSSSSKQQQQKTHKDAVPPTSGGGGGEVEGVN